MPARVGDVFEPGLARPRAAGRFLRGAGELESERARRSAGEDADVHRGSEPPTAAVHRRRLRRCSAAFFTSGESGLSCAACCSAAAARSHSPSAIVALATPTHASTRVGSILRRATEVLERVARALAIHLDHPRPDERARVAWIAAKRGVEGADGARFIAAAPEDQSLRLVRAAQRRVDGDGAVGGGARPREIVLLQVARREIHVGLEPLGISWPRPVRASRRPRRACPRRRRPRRDDRAARGRPASR